MKRVTRRIITIIGVVLALGGLGMLMVSLADEITFNGLDFGGFFFIAVGFYLIFAKEESLLSWILPDLEDEDEEDDDYLEDDE